jgi:hypothetical protein
MIIKKFTRSPARKQRRAAMEQWISFVRDQWPVIVVAVVVAAVLIKVVKSVLKWLLVILIAAAVLIYGFNHAPEELAEAGAKLREAVETTKEKAIAAMLGDAGDARFERTEDGFRIEGERFTLEGKNGETEVTLEYFGQTFTIEMNEQIRAFVEKVKSASR